MSDRRFALTVAAILLALAGVGLCANWAFHGSLSQKEPVRQYTVSGQVVQVAKDESAIVQVYGTERYFVRTSGLHAGQTVPVYIGEHSGYHVGLHLRMSLTPFPPEVPQWRQAIEGFLELSSITAMVLAFLISLRGWTQGRQPRT